MSYHTVSACFARKDHSSVKLSLISRGMMWFASRCVRLQQKGANAQRVLFIGMLLKIESCRLPKMNNSIVFDITSAKVSKQARRSSHLARARPRPGNRRWANGPIKVSAKMADARSAGESGPRCHDCFTGQKPSQVCVCT